jgi:hypothetical protein
VLKGVLPVGAVFPFDFGMIPSTKGEDGKRQRVQAGRFASDRAQALVTATETEFFARADMLDTKVGQTKKDDPAAVAQTGFDAMMRGDGDVVSGCQNKLQSAIANITPAGVLAEQHRKMAEPGNANR